MSTNPSVTIDSVDRITDRNVTELHTSGRRQGGDPRYMVIVDARFFVMENGGIRGWPVQKAFYQGKLQLPSFAQMQKERNGQTPPRQRDDRAGGDRPGTTEVTVAEMTLAIVGEMTHPGTGENPGPGGRAMAASSPAMSMPRERQSWVVYLFKRRCG